MDRPAAPRRIQRLSQQLANQIAAGEVVERPASVLKELLENSADAGARLIEVEVEQGGTRLLRVRDDGCGIHQDDLALALSPHATSKIRDQGDLVRVASLGFRGEALASIASVSRLTITSRMAGAGEAWQLEGLVQGPVPAALPAGTSVEVRDLFYNTPARRKFLRSERTEFSHIEEVFRRFVLSRSDTAFTLRHNGRQIMRLRAGAAGDLGRVGAVLGASFVEHAQAVEFEAAGMRLWGWAAQPEFSRPQNDMQYFYVNGRVIRDKLVNHAVRQAFEERLPEGRFPAYVLYFELDPALVDVNVHPTKHEVRFREARMVHDFIHRGLSRALAGDAAEEDLAMGHVVRESSRPYVAPLMAAASRGAGRAALAACDALYRASRPQSPAKVAPVAPAGPLGTALALLQGRYVLAEDGSGLVVVNLDAAITRIATGRLLAARQAGAVRPQPLLIPETVELDMGLAEWAEAHPDALLALGLDVDRLGPDTLVVRQIPALLRGAEVKPLVGKVVRMLADGAATELVLQVMAGFVLVDRRMSVSEMNALLREVEALPSQESAPCWGRLTAHQLDQLAGGKGQPEAGEC